MLTILYIIDIVTKKIKPEQKQNQT